MLLVNQKISGLFDNDTTINNFPDGGQDDGSSSDDSGAGMPTEEDSGSG